MDKLLEAKSYLILIIHGITIILLSRGWRKFQEFALETGKKEIKHQAEIFRYWTIAFMILFSIFLIETLNQLISTAVRTAMAYLDSGLFIAIFLAVLAFLGKINLKSFIKSQQYDRMSLLGMQLAFLLAGFVIATFLTMTKNGITIKEIVEAHYK